MHLHIGAVDFLIFSAYVIIFAYIWRTLSAWWADRPIGQAMAYIL